ncbi:MAG: subclass B3 metallo-beta-lactamase [Thermoanaerobaculia bacterium]
MARILSLLLALLCSSSALAQLSEKNLAWNQPVEPFRVIGNVYYVGASQLSSYLIVTPDGLILLDSGARETVPLIEANLKKLGFALKDVRILLGSHAHFDHGGGLAELKRKTGASFITNALEAPEYARGDRGHHTWGDEYAFEPVTADRLVKHGEVVTLGGVSLRAHITPGHTDGCTAWTMQLREDGRPIDVVFLGGLSVPGYQLVGNANAPNIVAQYEEGFRVAESLRGDVFLGMHGWEFGLHEKLAMLAAGASRNPFVDPAEYPAYVARQKERFRRTVAEQTASRELDRVYAAFADGYTKLDAVAVGSLYEEDALYLTPSDSRSIIRGSHDITAQFTEFFDSVKNDGGRLAIRFSIVDRQISDGLATDAGYFELTRFGRDGTSGRSAGKFAGTLRRQSDGRWKFRVDSYTGSPEKAFDEATGRIVP